MLYGYRMVQEMIEGLTAFMEKHSFERITDFHGHSLEYFTTHADLVERQKAAKIAKAGLSNRDNEWAEKNFTDVTKDLTAN